MFNQNIFKQAQYAILILTALTGIYILMTITKKPLPDNLQTLFNDVTALNEHARKEPLTLKNYTIDGFDISGVIFNKASFSNTEWSDVTAKNSKFTNTTFIDTVFKNVNLKKSKFSNVIFENVEFIDTDLIGSEIVNIQFNNCKFIRSELHSLRNSSIEVNNSVLDGTTFFLSTLRAKFNDSKLTAVRLEDLKLPSSLSFNKGNINFELSRSSLEKLSIAGSTLTEAGGIKNTIKEVFLKDLKGDSIVLGYSNIDKATIESSELDERGFSIPDANIKSLTVIGANHGVVSIDGKHGEIKIINSIIPELDFDGAAINNLHIQNSKIEDGVFENLKAKKLEFENVTLDGPMNFKNAQIDQFINKNTTQTPRAVIDLSGSNIKF